ncbi:MAG: AAA family ATPase [Sphaerochaeta sp.]|jgi:predicted ATP-dependent protease|uniref:Lon protease family protein n=1 Tax=Sphaerochaeta sp. TaxID=1972642 RepID=UPI00258E13FF|nr:AAA family ATPase [Sphaerochaeta sp.]MDT3359677.1 AAA family ATPase [Spirochaetota bacterium]MDD3424222.1 AAA family ATPase [Sphaerochaeta sp.]MDD4037597.1 AAA family ATPase [Sphaerochaeta sp.]MDD4449471.1 AAA family ATPase [Sphaerochaeta sp.]MDX9983167.1 AAA family ATPase [Sphaerochaeta sp.]
MTDTQVRVKPLTYEEASFDFDLATIRTCRALGSSEPIVGQPRALRTLELGLSLSKSGYNIFVSGDSGSGRHKAVRHAVQNLIHDTSSLCDLVYVYNFLQPNSPRVLTFACGDGQLFCDASEAFNQELLSLALQKRDFYATALELVSEFEAQFPQASLRDHFDHIRMDLKRMDKHIQGLDEKACKADPIATKYRANLLVNHAKTTQRPFIIESHPSFSNLFGSVDNEQKMPHLGLHAGTLLEASGGFLVIDAEELLSEQGLWDALKRYLDANALTVESGAITKGELRSASIRPQMPPLPVKVILIGSEETYDTLTEGDERFLTLFKLCAQFDYSMNLDEKAIAQTIANLDSYAKQNQLLELSDEAFLQLLRYSCWYVESREHLSTQFSTLYDLLEEANWWARYHRKNQIDDQVILTAHAEREYANGISETKINEEIISGDMIISLSGTKVGVVNGLAVMDRGSASFGTPTVISCTVAPGNEGIVNIEHEAGLSGEIHDKGLLILEGYLRKHYARTFPLSIYAGIAFEQSYAEVDGDSASSSELYALLSAIGELPVRQDIAVTGSVNQMGMIQPVGGINEKIEGFFHTCQATGLTGRQGVIIPFQNVRNLILGYEVLEAIKAKQFFIYPIKTIDEGMQLLTERPAGIRNAKGNYSAGNFNYDIEDRLRKMYQAVLANRG